MEGEEEADDGGEEKQGAVNVELAGAFSPGDFGFGFAMGCFEEQDDDGKGDGADGEVDVDCIMTLISKQDEVQGLILTAPTPRQMICECSTH